MGLGLTGLKGLWTVGFGPGEQINLGFGDMKDLEHLGFDSAALFKFSWTHDM